MKISLMTSVQPPYLKIKSEIHNYLALNQSITKRKRQITEYAVSVV